jgi:Fe2+ or Zn2+ uptake regulation protein
MAKSFAQKLIEDRRLVILRLLSEQAGQTSNSSVLHMGVQHLGHIVERATVFEDLRFLQLHNLVSIEQLTDTVYGVHLTGRGEDLVHGRVEIDGVSRPRRGV